MVCWARDARATGAEPASLLVQRVQTAHAALWNVVTSLQRGVDETEERWTQRCAQSWLQLAPILDRMGRLLADCAAVLRCLASGGEILATPPAGGGIRGGE